MAGLQETSSWEDDIYQIEQTDPVLGGPPDLAQGHGFANIPHAQLANRTAWLRAQIIALQEQVANIDVQPLIDAAIANLVNGAPAALDTLNELAAALTDTETGLDALLAALAGKLDAAQFTGANILAALLPVDGDGCGLDADLLDGFQATDLMQRDAWENLAPGGIVASGTDEVEFQFDNAAFSAFEINLHDFRPDTFGAYLQAQPSDDGGASYKSSGLVTAREFSYGATHSAHEGTLGHFQIQATSGQYFTPHSSTAGRPAFHARIRTFEPGKTDGPAMFHVQSVFWSSVYGTSRMEGWCYHQSDGAMDALRIYASSGQVSGNASFHGLRR